MAITGHAEEYMFSNDYSEIPVAYEDALIAGKQSQFIVHENVPLYDTYKVGEVLTTYESLVKIFGEPVETNTKNTDVEWRIRLKSGESVSIYNWQNGRSYCSTHDCVPKGGYPTHNIIRWHIGAKAKATYSKTVYIIGKENIIRTCVNVPTHPRTMVLDYISRNWYKYIDEYYTDYRRDAYNFDMSAEEFDRTYDKYHKYDSSYWKNLIHILDKRYSAPITELDYNEPGLFYGFCDFAHTKYSEYCVDGVVIDTQAEAVCIKRIDKDTVLIKCIGDVWVMQNTRYAPGDVVTVGLTMMNKTHKDGTFMVGDDVDMFQIVHVRHVKKRVNEVKFFTDVTDIVSHYGFAKVVSMDITSKLVTVVIDNDNASDGVCYELSRMYNRLCSLLNKSTKVSIVKLNDDSFTATRKDILTYEDTIPMIDCEGGPCPE